MLKIGYEAEVVHHKRCRRREHSLFLQYSWPLKRKRVGGVGQGAREEEVVVAGVKEYFFLYSLSGNYSMFLF